MRGTPPGPNPGGEISPQSWGPEGCFVQTTSDHYKITQIDSYYAIFHPLRRFSTR